MSITASVGIRSHASKAKKIKRPTELAALANIQAQAPKPSVVVLALVNEPPAIDGKARFWQTVDHIISHFRENNAYTARNAHRGIRAAQGIADRLADVGIYCTPAMVVEALRQIEDVA